jgi:hypothetical protein
LKFIKITPILIQKIDFLTFLCYNKNRKLENGGILMTSEIIRNNLEIINQYRFDGPHCEDERKDTDNGSQWVYWFVHCRGGSIQGFRGLGSCQEKQ